MQVQMPAARRLAQLPEQYADGGLVARMKSADAGPAAFGSRGLSQLRDMVPKVAAMGYPQQAAAPAPAPAPVSDPRAAQLMAMIPQMEAMGFKQKPQMLARGGMVRGPGTGTSDSIPDEVEPGTYIMPADSTAAIGPSALEKMGTVPVRLSDGEMKLPPEQVMAIGEAVLKLMKDATHTPVNGEDGGQTDAEVGDDDGARGFNPADRMAQMPQMYADGGSVGFQRMDIGQWAQDQEQGRDDLARFEARQAVARQEQADADEYARQQAEQAKRMAEQPAPAAGMYADGGLVDNNVTRVGNSYSGGNVGGAITVNGAAPYGTFNENPGGRTAPVPAPQPDPSIVSMIRPTPSPAPSAAPVAASPSTAAAQPMGWAERNAQRNAEVSAASITNRPEWSKTATSRPAGLGAPPPVPSIAPPAPVPSLSSFGYQPRRYADGGMVHRLPLPPGYKPRGYFGGDTVVDDRQQQADDLQKRLMQIPSSAPPGWNGGGGGSGGGGGAGGVTGSWDAPQAAPAPAPAQPAGALTRAASMSAPAPAVQAMGTLPLNPNGGQVSTQSMGAADGLARRGAADALAQMPSAPAPVQAPTVLTSENSWQKRNDLRNALVSASSITNNGGKWDRHKGESPESLTYRAMLGTDQALQASAPGLAQAAMREQGDLQRTGLQVTAQSAQGAADRQNALERTLIGERGNNTRAGISALAATEAARLKAQQEGKAPPGYRWKADGGMEPIPGGPAAAKVADDAKTRESGFDGSRQAIGTINRLLASPGRQGATGGWNMNRFIPGNQSADFAAEVETLKAQTFLPMIQQLRGMGALSNAEGDKINAAVGALNFNMSEPAFAESLGRIRDQLGSALQRSGVDTKDLANWGLEEPTSTATKPSGNAPAPSPAVTPTSAMKIDTQQAFADLPSGSRFIAPDGSVRVKP